jgi:dihydroorotate dehydrogenase (NAD+) catalytic subunit
MVDLSINLNGLKLQNPVMTASGTFGYGEEFADFIDLSKLGAIVVKGITVKPREGNPYPRMVETASGMLNSVGLQNKGIDNFVSDIYPRIKELNNHIIVNVSGSVIDDFRIICEKLNDLEKVTAVEVNISCPNVKEGGMAFGTSCLSAAEVTKLARKSFKRHVMVKLSPNVTDVAEIARYVEGAGADSLSLINTLLGIAIDHKTRKPKLATFTGGLSGPCIKPVALRMVWQVARAVKIPVVGMGGIMNAADAIEFIIAGASAVQIGTANFIDPQVTIKVIDGIEKYLKENNFSSVNELVGNLQC